jgi:large subunit ribosomal protein L9
MKLILTAAVDKLGLAGDVVEVKDGYGRNYLVPRGFAIRWTKGGEKQIDGIKRSRDAREIRGLDHASEVRTQLEDLTIQLPVRAGETGKLFGAVTPPDVVGAIKKAGGPTVDKRSIEISTPIKSVGPHTVGVKLHDAVTAHIQLDVVRQA